MISFLEALSLTGLPILLLVSGVEYFCRGKKYPNEYTRKFIHILVGTYAAFWPLFLSWLNIELLGIGALCALIVSRMFHVFRSMHFVRQHPTGEFLASMSITLIALISHDALLFAIAILHLSLADGFAAIAGTKLGKKTSYIVFGSRKSIIGSGVFFVISVVLVSVYIVFDHNRVAWPVLIWLPPLATLTENLAVNGTDNLLVPLVVALGLRWL
jgi:phytol kinase